MKKTIFFCDRCGRQIREDENRVRVAFEQFRFQDGVWLQNDGDDLGDFCPECFENLKEVLANSKTEPAPAPKRAHPKTRKELDMGKVGALHRAGWSLAKIADEMGVSIGTLQKRIRQEMEKEAVPC